MKLLFILFIPGLLLYSSCIEPYNPDINDYLDLLVVDASITNDQGPYTVKLSRTSDINKPEVINEPDAVVIISDDNGNSETLKQKSAGVYQTSESGIQGIIGRKYKLYIKTKDNQEYETAYTELSSPLEIDSLYGIFDIQQTGESFLNHEGYQFYIKTHTISDKTSYLFWEPIETYEYQAEFPIEEYYDVRKREFKPYPNPYEFFTCYQTLAIKDILYLKINGVNNNITHPLFFASADANKKLSIKYSLQVNQYNVNEENYNYRKNLKNILSQGNTLYNIQPFQISGNIKNITNTKEPVLGYFTVAGVTHKRIFVLPIQTSNYYDWCIPNSRRYGNIIAYGSKSTEYATRDQNGVMGTIGGSCIDCRLKGGTQQRPEYWNEK